MVYVCAILAAMLVTGAGLAWRYRRRYQEACRRGDRALAERDEVVSFVNHFARGMSSSRDPQAWLLMVAGYLAPLVKAQGVLIFLVEGDQLVRRAQSGTLPTPVTAPEYALVPANRLLENILHRSVALGEGLLGEVALTDRTALVEEFVGSPPPAVAPLRSLLAVPLRLNDQVVGVLCAVNKLAPGGKFTGDDRYLLEALSGPVALGGVLSLVLADLQEKERLEQELQLAKRLQEALLPKQMPASPHFVMAAHNLPALEVSGDYFDVIAVDEDHLLVVIADASGKGVPACLLMAMCRSFLRMNALRYKEDLEGLLRELHAVVWRDASGDQYITLACCLLDLRDLTVEYARAGHTEMLLRLPTGEIAPIAPDGAALGMVPLELAEGIDTLAFVWEPGTAMLLFTDGITEAERADKEQFGLARLVAAWRAAPDDPAAAVAAIFAAVKDFTGDSEQTDDQTLVILRRRG